MPKTIYEPLKRGVGRYTLPDGTVRYRVVVKKPNSNRTVTKAGFRTSGAASAHLKNLEGQVGADKARRTFGPYAVDWLATHRTTTGAALRPKTAALYESLLRIHIGPTWDNCQFRAIDRQAVKAWHAKLLDSHLSQATVAKAYRLLRQILDSAVDDGYLPTNPCSIKGAAIERNQSRTATTPSLEDVYRLAAAVPAKYRPLVLLAGVGGLRWGEAIALRRSDFGPDCRTVMVARQVIELSGRLAIGPPKTDEGNRTVHLPAALAGEISKHLRTLPADPAALLWPARQRSGHVSYLRGSNFRRSVWAPALKKTGLAGVHFHDLRHTAGTSLATAGVPTKVIMAQLGHASTAATLRYQHAAASAQADAAAAVDALLPSPPPAATGTDNVVPLRRK